MQAYDTIIRVHGWAIVQVGDPGGPTFAYTVGLVENFGLPELFVIDVDPRHQQGLLNEVAADLIAHGRPAPGTPTLRGVRCVEVHANHLDGEWFGTWVTRYDRFLQPGEMMQVLLPDSAYCACHAPMVRRLDRPGPVPPLPSAPNRAQRRRRSRRAA